MKFAVLNGSPKGDKSVTLQYVRYIQKRYPHHDLDIINLSQRINTIEKDDVFFQSVMQRIRESAGIIWATPVYYLLVPASYKRFIERIVEKNAESVFNGKYTAVLTTSIHFFDHTAHNYLHAICDDLNMAYLGSYSADMYDLLVPEERERFEAFADTFFKEVENRSSTSRSFGPLHVRDFRYQPGGQTQTVDLKGRKLLLLTDAMDNQTNLGKMIERFRRCFADGVETIDINAINISGYCLGCLQCAYDNHCAYEGKDDFSAFFQNTVMQADVLVFSGAIKDRYLSSRWKLFFDRSFFKGHVPSLSRKQIGWLISGPLSQVPNLRQILEAYGEIQRTDLVDVITDEFGDSSHLDALIDGFAKRVADRADRRFTRAPTFLGIAGAMLFRDEIWGRLRFPFRADYVAYKAMGAFRFPQKKWKSRIGNAIMLVLSKSERFRGEVNRRMKDEMIKPFEAVLKK